MDGPTRGAGGIWQKWRFRRLAGGGWVKLPDSSIFAYWCRFNNQGSRVNDENDYEIALNHNGKAILVKERIKTLSRFALEAVKQVIEIGSGCRLHGNIGFRKVPIC